MTLRSLKPVTHLGAQATFTYVTSNTSYSFDMRPETPVPVVQNADAQRRGMWWAGGRPDSRAQRQSDTRQRRTADTTAYCMRKQTWLTDAQASIRTRGAKPSTVPHPARGEIKMCRGSAQRSSLGKLIHGCLSESLRLLRRPLSCLHLHRLAKDDCSVAQHDGGLAGARRLKH